MSRRNDDPLDEAIDFYKKELELTKLRRAFLGREQEDPSDDLEIKSEKEELMRGRLRRDILLVNQEIEELGKPKPSMLDEIVGEATKRVKHRVAKKMADLMTSGLENNPGMSAVSPVAYATDGILRGLIQVPDKKEAEKPAGPGHPSGTPAPSQASEAGGRKTSQSAKPGEVKSQGTIISPERFRLLDPPQKEVLFASVLPAVRNLPKILGAMYGFGEQKKKWTVVVESFNPEVANQAREIILREMGMDVVCMTADTFLFEAEVNKKGEDGQPLLAEPVISVLRSSMKKRADQAGNPPNQRPY